MDPTNHTREARLSPWPHVMWFGLVAGFVGVILLAAGSTDHPEGQCSGIGWGCTLSGGDLAAFVGGYLVPPALIVLGLGHLVIAAIQRRR